jgi:hypothetical protein
VIVFTCEQFDYIDWDMGTGRIANELLASMRIVQPLYPFLMVLQSVKLSSRLGCDTKVPIEEGMNSLSI